MKKTFLKIVLMFLPFAAHAQGSVSLFGILDAGITYTSNVGGHSYVGSDTGIQAPNLIGLRGTEPLGAGYAAIFVLDGSFSLGSGEQIGGGTFGRESYVGLSSIYGTLTLGKQFDYMYDALSISRWNHEISYVSLYQLPDGPYSGLGTPNGPFDYTRMAGSSATPNTIKYTSNHFMGFDFGAMYGFSNVPGQTGSHNLSSFGANYANGPLRVDVAYTYSKEDVVGNGAGGIRNFGAGGRYDFGGFAVDALYENTRNTFNGAAVDSYELGGLYSFAPDIFAYLQYIYTKGNPVLTNNNSNQLGLTFDYLLSKRSDVYINAVYQHARGGAYAFAAISGTPGSSSSENQTVLRVGMRHLF